jgi:hypothetical protein
MPTMLFYVNGLVRNFSPTRKENQMSVSLRVEVAEIALVLVQYDNGDWSNRKRMECAKAISKLFPPQLTEEQIKETLKGIYDLRNLTGIERGQIASALIGKCGSNKDKYGLHEDGICYYCGKMTNNLSGNPSEWSIALCHRDEPGKVKIHHTGCVTTRLIENQATPTFSGEKKPPYCSHFNQDGCTQNCFECDYSTEQKEYCECKEPRGQIKGSNPYQEPDICLTCHKPIPVEKKEYIGGTISLNDLPKPKDRIEELTNETGYVTVKFINKINEIIRHINKES